MKTQKRNMIENSKRYELLVLLKRSKKKKKLIADKEQMYVEEENRLGKVDFKIGNRWVQIPDRYVERSRDIR
jgi:hypothetical protein